MLDVTLLSMVGGLINMTLESDLSLQKENGKLEEQISWATRELDKVNSELLKSNRELSAAKATVEDFKRIIDSRSRNICSNTREIWEISLTLMILIGGIFTAALTWYFKGHDVALSIIVFIGFGMSIIPSYLIFREYIRRNFVVDGGRLD